jgi:hypothetical protein
MHDAELLGQPARNGNPVMTLDSFWSLLGPPVPVGHHER